MQHVYLAGPIAGLTQEEAKKWRAWVAEHLPEGFVGVNPLRCEPLIGERYENVYDDPKFGTPDAIIAKNWYDLHRCEWTLIYMPREMNERRISIGTVVEMAWAYYARKPTILVTDDPRFQEHPLVRGQVRWILGSFEEAFEVLEGVGRIYG